MFKQSSLAALTPPDFNALSTSLTNLSVFVVAKFRYMILSIAIAKPKIKQANTIPINPGPPSINLFLSS